MCCTRLRFPHAIKRKVLIKTEWSIRFAQSILTWHCLNRWVTHSIGVEDSYDTVAVVECNFDPTAFMHIVVLICREQVPFKRWILRCFLVAIHVSLITILGMWCYFADFTSIRNLCWVLDFWDSLYTSNTTVSLVVTIVVNCQFWWHILVPASGRTLRQRRTFCFDHVAATAFLYLFIILLLYVGDFISLLREVVSLTNIRLVSDLKMLLLAKGCGKMTGRWERILGICVLANIGDLLKPLIKRKLEMCKICVGPSLKKLLAK